MNDTTISPVGNPTAELIAALAKAQGEFKRIEKNREVAIQTRSNGVFKFRYADLDEIFNKTRPALSANGLALIQTIEQGPDGQQLTCKLMHAGGGVITSEITIPSARDYGGDPKAFGATITYFRRYMITAMLGVAADDDLDEDGQEMRQQPSKTPPAAQRNNRLAQAARAELKPYGDADFEQNLCKWRAVVESGRKTAEELISFISTRRSLSPKQRQSILGLHQSEDTTTNNESQHPAHATE